MVVPPAGADWDFLGFLTGRELVPLLGFGSGVGLDPPGFVSRRLSSVFSRVGVDAGLLRGSYSTPNLLGSGTVIAKVMPTARSGRGNQHLFGGQGGHRWSIPAPAGEPTRTEDTSAEYMVYPRACGGTPGTVRAQGNPGKMVGQRNGGPPGLAAQIPAEVEPISYRR